MTPKRRSKSPVAQIQADVLELCKMVQAGPDFTAVNVGMAEEIRVRDLLRMYRVHVRYWPDFRWVQKRVLHRRSVRQETL